VTVLETSLWFRTMYARTWVRVKSMYGEPLWLVVGIAFPLLTTFGLGFLYRSSGVGSYAGFAVLGGVAVSFWSNVVWSMATQFYWDKQEGIFELYLVSPAPISAILVGMSIGGFVGTAPSALLVGVIGWQVFGSAVSPAWTVIAIGFALTIIALYSLGMLLASVYLAYGRGAESLNDSVQQSVSMFSGVYFPTIGLGSPFPVSLQLVLSLVPLTIGMDVLRKAVFSPAGGAATFPSVYQELLILGVLCVVFFVAARRAIDYMRDRGRRNGSLVVRLR
jgi:ABC-2 type transport system permease protein